MFMAMFGARDQPRATMDFIAVELWEEHQIHR